MSSKKRGNNSYTALKDMGSVFGPIVCGEYFAFRFSEDEEGQMTLMGNGKTGHPSVMYFRKNGEAWVETLPLKDETPRRFNRNSTEYIAFELLLESEEFYYLRELSQVLEALLEEKVLANRIH